MVTVYFELPDEEIISTSKYFNNSYTDEWLDDWAERVIREIDKSELVSEGMVKSPVLGPITIREISGGAKAPVSYTHLVPIINILLNAVMRQAVSAIPFTTSLQVPGSNVSYLHRLPCLPSRESGSKRISVMPV